MSGPNARPQSVADVDALPGAPAHYASADCVDHAGDFVPRDPREGEVRPLTFDRETVAVAYTAGLDPDADLAPRWLGYVALHETRAWRDCGKMPLLNKFPELCA